MKSLKGLHFSNYLFNLMMTTYNDYISNQNEPENNLNISQAKKDSSTNKNIHNNKNDIIQRNQKIYNPRKFKSLRNLDYHFKYKAPQFNDFTKRNQQFLFKDFYGTEKISEKTIF